MTADTQPDPSIVIFNGIPYQFKPSNSRFNSHTGIVAAVVRFPFLLLEQEEPRIGKTWSGIGRHTINVVCLVQICAPTVCDDCERSLDDA